MRPRGTLGLMFAADRVQDLLRRLREDVAGLIHSEIDLAKTEVIEKIKMYAKSAVFIAIAVPFMLLALLAFLFGAIAVLALAVTEPAEHASCVGEERRLRARRERHVGLGLHARSATACGAGPSAP